MSIPDITAAVRQYLREVERLLASGTTTEHSYRPALASLLQAALPDTQVINEPGRIACGAPDLLVNRHNRPLGYIEAKDIGVSLNEAEKSPQLKRYLSSLRSLILTDYCEFRLYLDGNRHLTAVLAEVNPQGKLVRAHDGVVKLTELLTHFYDTEAVQPVATAKELAQKLAALACLLRDVIGAAYQQEDEHGKLHNQQGIISRMLLPDLTPAMFADLYAQTIAYGLFTARTQMGDDRSFTHHDAIWHLGQTSPFLQELFTYIAGPAMDDKLAWVVDDMAALLARARMADVLQDFGKQSGRDDPVVHFYETFLAAYDPAMREKRGVYYTPAPVVSYIVRSVDEILKTRFGRSDGLADKDTIILDPACGTGTFLYQVLQQVHQTMEDRNQLGAWPGYVHERLIPRLFGFELLMAPYTIAHLKLGMALKETGYTLQPDERLGIYLTNTLEEPRTRAESLPGFASFIAEEGNQAALIKRDKPIMVILGNPPYSGTSANASYQRINGKRELNFIGKLLQDYYYVDGHPLGEKNPKWLQDDYVKFIRWAQWRIEETGYGVLGFITNHGYLDNPTFRGMRQSLMRTFDELYVLDLHGNSKKKEKAPDGSVDENVFDIQQGVAILLAVKLKEKVKASTELVKVQHSQMWGEREAKYQVLVDSVLSSTNWSILKPSSPYCLFEPQDSMLRHEYEVGWPISGIMLMHNMGVTTGKDAFATSYEEQELIQRIMRLRSSENSEKIRLQYGLEDTSSFNLEDARRWAKNPDAIHKIKSFDYRCFDRRYVIYSSAVLARPREDLFRHFINNLAIVTFRAIRDSLWHHVFIAQHPVAKEYLSSLDNCFVFPLYLYSNPSSTAGTLFATNVATRSPNLTPAFIAALSDKLGLTFIPDGVGDLVSTWGPEDAFHYMYAVFYSPAYRARYAEFLKIDFPRLPLTADRALFSELAALGSELVGLHLLTAPAVNAGGTAYPIAGSNLVEKVAYAAGRVYINPAQYFEGVPSEVWEMQIGGYQVCEKWLKDRKGRTLSYDDIEHYQKVVAALSRTLELQAEIDRVIDSHGGWPLN